VLLQVRESPIPLKQEQSCFIERCRVARRQFTFINLTEEPQLRWRHVESAHAVLIGGAGAYSAVDFHPFTAPLRDVVERLMELDRPILGSCWGHQFLAGEFGGQVVEDKDHSEVGTFTVRLTPAGRSDPLFREFPDQFPVQLGHNDRVSRVGPGWLELAASERCPYQVIRLDGKPVYGTQFHSELSEQRLRDRLDVYRESYAAAEEEYNEIVRTLRPTVLADGLMARFLELYA
jgi:GMP synthase (glutamine-hydrolysing)